MNDSSIHPTAIIEVGVEVGPRTSIWDHAHLRGPDTRVGSDCIVGEKSYLGPGVVVGDLCKINAMVYLPTGVVLGRGVMVGAGAVFTNDRYPRATDPALEQLRSSAPGPDTLDTRVGDGATIGAGARIGPGVAIGRFAMIGMGAVVTRSIGDHLLAVGNPARVIAVVCRCGEPVRRWAPGAPIPVGELVCASCGRSYELVSGTVAEL